MMQYDGDLKLPARFLVPPPAISGVSGELLAKAGVSTFACSETQKFGHVRSCPPCCICCLAELRSRLRSLEALEDRGSVQKLI